MATRVERLARPFSFDFLKSKAEAKSSRPATNAWRSPPPPHPQESIADELPWREYCPETKSFLLEDGKSVGAIWEVEPINTEGRTDDYKYEIANDLLGIVSDAIPEVAPMPWVLQVYVSDEADLRFMAERIRAYSEGPAARSTFSAEYARRMEAHLKAISREGGYFDDTTVTDGPWRGKQRRIRIALFRRLGRQKPFGGMTPDEELAEAAASLEQAFKTAGVGFCRYDGADFYDWMVKWFNPKPPLGDGDSAELIKLAPYPGDDDAPYGRDFSEMLFFQEPFSDQETGFLFFDDVPHTIVTTLGVKKAPKPGHFTGEQKKNNRAFALFDKLPEHTILAMTITFQPQDLTENHIASVEENALGGEMGANLVREEAQLVRLKMAKGDPVYPVEIVAYVRGDNPIALRRAQRETSSLFHQSGIHAIDSRHETLLIDRWFDNLPMAYRTDKLDAHRRGRLHYTSHIARLLPVFGRSRGTGNPGLVFYNRGGEPYTIDPLTKLDRAKNAHLLLLGPTGAGKSATLAKMLMSEVAAHNPRLFIIERGRSFNLLGDFFARYDKTVNALDLRPGCNVSLPPFADAFRLLDKKYEYEFASQTEQSLQDSDTDDENEDHRDILGELEIIARLMITGGEDKEDERITRSDRLTIRDSILQAARMADAHSDDLVTPAHIVKVMNDMAADGAHTDRRRERIKEMADAMALFTDPRSIGGQLFNRGGTAWPESDVTLLDLGTLANDGNEGELSIAYISLINTVSALVERDEYDERQTIVVTDEGHVITTNPLLSRSVVKITKMWRKLGAWYWLATQSLSDFPDASRNLLSMMEFWLLLTMTKDEVEDVARFKNLDPETRSLILSARKEDRKFTEGALITDREAALVRLVPPSIALALGQTEKHEKALRAKLMREHDLPCELDAAEMIAAQMDASR